MAGKLVFPVDQIVRHIRSRVYMGVESTASAVLDEAVTLAPTRKNRKAGGRAVRLSLTQQVRFGGKGGRGHKAIKLSGADIYAAAKRIGIAPEQLRGGRIRVGGRNIQGAPGFRSEGEQRRGVGELARLPSSLGNTGSAKFQAHVERVRLSAKGRNAFRGLHFANSGETRTKGKAALFAEIEAYEAGGGGDAELTFGGFLRKHIHMVDESDATTIRFSVKSDAPYSRYVEFPTRRTAAQPFLLPALKRARGTYRGQLKRSWG